MSSGRILVIRGGAIGDFILTLPVLQALQEEFPKANVDVLGYPNVARLATLGGLAQATRGIEARAVAGFFARNGDLDQAWMEYFSEFEIIISYLYDPDEIFKTNVGRCSKAQFIEGQHRPFETENSHATQVFLKPLERLAIFDADDVPRLEIPSPDRPPQQPCLALHPGSGSTQKNWPMDRWMSLIQHLLDHSSWNLLIVGGEAERTNFQQWMSDLKEDRIQIELCRPLDELAPLIAACQGFIGHDSGISHLAAAIGLPGLVLWGPSKESIWRPKSENVVVIHHEDGIDLLPVEQVLARIPSPGWQA